MCAKIALISSFIRCTCICSYSGGSTRWLWAACLLEREIFI